MQPNMPSPVFADIPDGTGKPKQKPTKPVANKPVNKKPSTKTPAKLKRKRMAEGKVNVCYCVDESLRDDMQALSFMLRKSQSDIVSEALRTYIKRQGVQLPKRAA